MVAEMFYCANIVTELILLERNINDRHMQEIISCQHDLRRTSRAGDAWIAYKGETHNIPAH